MFLKKLISQSVTTFLNMALPRRAAKAIQTGRRLFSGAASRPYIPRSDVSSLSLVSKRLRGQEICTTAP